VKKLLKDCMKTPSVIDTVMNSDHSYLLLEIELKASCHLDDETSASKPRAVLQCFQLCEEKYEDCVDMLTNDPRLDCQHHNDQSDALHAAVLVQNVFFLCCHQMLWPKTTNFKGTFSSDKWYDSIGMQRAADKILMTCEVRFRYGRKNGSQEDIPRNGE
jgi:hypothetical protein